MKYIAFFFFIIINYPAHSQSYNPDAVNKKAKASYDQAMQAINDGDIQNAIPILNKAVEYDGRYVDAILSLAGVYGEMKNYQKAVDNYRKAFAVDSSYTRFFLLPYSINLAGLGRFDDALEAVQSFSLIPNLNEKTIKSAAYRKSCYEFAINNAKHTTSGYTFNPVNLGDSVNSPFPEYYPSFTIDDSILVFTRRTAAMREDFAESILTKNGYGASSLIKGDINADPFKGAINISQDGEWLLFAADMAGKGAGNYDLYQAYSTSTGWSEPVNMGLNINTEFWESSPSLSPDKNALYFSSDRPGGYGGKDLYVSYRTSKGEWSEARNMGPDINTPGDEIAPFIHADNQTLYYTSNGLPGYGGTDLYVVRKTGDRQWSIPQNLGYPVNTIENEGSIFVAANGITAYYASDRADTRGGLDLYKFDLKENVRPVKTLYVKGYVTDSAIQKGLPCAVELSDDSTQKTITKVQTDETGFYFITLPAGRNYTFTVERNGYLFYSDVFNLAGQLADSTYTKNIALKPISVNASVVLKNIQFETNSYNLEAVSAIELNKLVKLMNDNPAVQIEIDGHTDNVGDETDNLKLSEQRAKAVAAYLEKSGVNRVRISSKGFGETKPVADNSIDKGRALNRRTEFIVKKM